MTMGKMGAIKRLIEEVRNSTFEYVLSLIDIVKDNYDGDIDLLAMLVELKLNTPIYDVLDGEDDD